MGRQPLTYVTALPRMFRCAGAAAYVGLSETKFLQLVEDGRAPRPVLLDGCVLWSRLALDAFCDDLENAAAEENTAHAALVKMGM